MGYEHLHWMRSYSSNMSEIGWYEADLPTIETFNEAYYKDVLNKDSMLLFTQGTSPGSNVVKWRMEWVNLHLSPINLVTYTSPLTVLSPVRYRTGYNRVALDEINRRIVVFAVENNNFQPAIIPKVFIYDYDFNLVCEMPIELGTKEDNTLIELNGLVYLKVKNANSDDLHLVNCDLLESTELQPNEKKLIRIVDIMGRDTEDKPNTVLIYIYNDGNTEKVFRVD